MKYLSGLKIKTLLTERGICYMVHYEDTLPEKCVFDIKVYATKSNALDWEIWLNGLCVHSGPSYLDLVATFEYCDLALADIIDNKLKVKDNGQAGT